MQPSLDSKRGHASISDLTTACISSFEKCCSRKDYGDHIALENGLADLRLWDYGVGATGDQRSSLDWRFRGRPKDIMLVKAILIILEDSLEEYYSSMDYYGVEEITKSIRSSLKNLATIGLAIRSTGKASRERRAESTFDPKDYEEPRKHLECIVLLRPSKAGLPLQLESSDLTIVQQRLIEANLMRLHRTVMARRRERNTERDWKSNDFRQVASDAGRIPGEVVSQSSKPHRTAGQQSKQKPHGTRALGGPSEASTAEGTLRYGSSSKYEPGVAMTNITAIGKNTEFPKGPLNPDGRLIGKCPCCCQSLAIELINDSEKWRQHVIEDMCPYTCIIEDCPKPKLLFSSRKAWEAHVETDHGSQWTCALCETVETPFQTERDMVDHLEDEHHDAIEEFEVSNLLDWSKCSRMGISTCPLCSCFGLEDSPEMIDHVLKHVFDFSLRALPWPIPSSAYEPRAEIGIYQVPEDQFKAGRLIGWIQDASTEIFEDLFADPTLSKEHIEHPCEYIERSRFDNAAPYNEDPAHATNETHCVPMDDYFDIEQVNDSGKPEGTTTISIFTNSTGNLSIESNPPDDLQHSEVIQGTKHDFETKFALTGAIHGAMSADSNCFATLLIFQFRFPTQKRGSRVSEAEIEVIFDVTDRGNEVPEVECISLDGKYSLVPSIQSETTTVGVHGDTSSNAGADTNAPSKAANRDILDATIIVGRKFQVDSITPDRGARWTIMESESLKTGVPAFIQLAVRVKRMDEAAFICIPKLKWKLNKKTFLQTRIHGVAEDDPIILNPLLMPIGLLEMYDAQELGSVDLQALADITVTKGLEAKDGGTST